MSVRFVIGRAGTGKTHHCLGAVRNELRASGVQGPPLILLVPEQASLQMERALLGDDLRAVARAEVLSFRRLAYRILQVSGEPERTALSAAARAMVLRAIVRRLGRQLRYYRRVERLGGFMDRLGSTIGELIDEAVTPGELCPDAGRKCSDPVRADKLADLAAIYDAYLDYLGDERLDPSQHLQVAREALGRCDYLSGARVWIDGFAGFTRQEMSLLADVATRSAGMDVTLLIDPEYHRRVGSLEDVQPSDLFARPQRTYLRLRDVLYERGLDVDPPLVLSPPCPARFTGGGELARLEAALASWDAQDDGTGAARTNSFVGGPRIEHGQSKFVRATQEPQGDRSRPSDVHFRQVPDRRTEVEFVVAEVCRLVRKSGGSVRYRDVAIIVRDLEPYHDLLTAALTERNVPFFIDRRRPASHHPLVEFIRAVIVIAAESFSVEAVRLLLKTELLEVDRESADELENYILAHGIAGRELWTGADWTYRKDQRVGAKRAKREQERLARVNAARRLVLERIGSFVEFAGTPANGAGWADAIRTLLGSNGAAGRLEQWARQAESDGSVELAEEHRQVWRDVSRFLDELGDALGEVTLDVGELAAIIDAGLVQLSVGLIPPTVDQVLVGSIERSRHPELKVAIIIGFNDGIFPLVAGEDSILNDEDREFLAGSDVRVGVTWRQRLLDEALLVYIAATRPSSKLLITCAAGDAEGKALRISPHARSLCRALPGLEVRNLGDPFRTRSIWPVLTSRDLGTFLTAEMRRRPPLSRDGTSQRRVWNSVYATARAADDIRVLLRRPLASLVYRNDASLTSRSVESLLGGTYRASVSELEAFAACPFKRFAEYGLRLRERVQAELEPADVGTIHHAILEELIKGMLERGEGLADLAEADVLARLRESADRIGATLGDESPPSSARDAYVLAHSAGDLSPVVAGQRSVAAAGRFRPRAAELRFGFADDATGLPPLEIDTPTGRRVLLRGVIDRVDLAEVGDEMLGIVVDYKRTRDKRLDLGSVYHGLSLQLLGYLLVLAERGEALSGRPIVPAGAFYVSLLQKYRGVDHPDQAEETDDDTGPAPRGILDGGRLPALDEAYAGRGWSGVFKVYRKTDGQLGHLDSSDAAEAGDFAAMLKHVRRKMGELADGVLNGDVSVTPYRLKDFSPCQWCGMNSVCRFEFGQGELRFLDGLKRSDVFERIR